MASLYGRGYRKNRVYYPVPFNRGNRFTLISAISFEKIIAAHYGEWRANGEIFLNFIERCVCPMLKKGQVVVMDIVSFHYVSGVKEAIEKTGARLIYLPPYSPDLNPIELKWSKIKNVLRKSAVRDLVRFKNEIKLAFESVHSNELNHWFQHCGYGS